MRSDSSEAQPGESETSVSDVKKNVTLEDWCLLGLEGAGSNEDIAERAGEDHTDSDPLDEDLEECVSQNEDRAESVTFNEDCESETFTKYSKGNNDIAVSVTSNGDSVDNEDPAETVTLNEDSADNEAPTESVFSKKDTSENEYLAESVTPNEDPVKSVTLNEEETASSNEEIEINEDRSSPITRDIINIPDLLGNIKMSKVYDVNGTTFVDDESLSSHDDDTVVRYELYKVNKMMTNDEGSEDEDIISELDVHIQNVPQGLIINSNVFLTDAQWHTMALVDEELFRCAICQMYCDRANCEDHIKTTIHVYNLERYKPLRRFDLSIVRKINNNLHCGVCNDIFDVIDYKTHENSKTHEGNLLTAINTVSDLMDDSNIDKTVYSDSNRQSGSGTDRCMINNDRSILSIDRNNIRTPDRDYRNNNEFYFNANEIGNVSVYECSDNEDDEEYVYEGEEYSTPHQGISYASMARKPRIDQPKLLKIDLGTKEVRVKFESWHMIIKSELNKFYCMVCKKQEHIRFKSQHCMSCDHKERLERCTVVGAFEDYLIRKVDDKLSHCGHCNNLQYHNQMNDHIESAHPKKSKNIIDTLNSPMKTKKPTKNYADKVPNRSVPEPRHKTECEKTAIDSKSLEYKIETKIDPLFDVFGNITLSPFGSELRISALAFNIILKRNDVYYCAICDKICADVKVHVEDLDHMEMMNMTPFIRPFKDHLTRAVRGTLHCSICNQLILVNDIGIHNLNQPHTTNLAIAMGMNITQKPDNYKKSTFIPSDQNNTASGHLKFPFTGVPNQPLPVQSSSMNIQATKNLSNILKLSENSNKTPPLLAQELSMVGKKGDAQNGAQLNLGQNGRNININASRNQNLPSAVQNTPFPGQNTPFPGQNTPFPGQNTPFPGQNLPHCGQNANGSHNFPPLFPPIPFPPPIKPQNNAQFGGIPLIYTNLNSPYPYYQVRPNVPPYFTAQNIPNQTNTTENKKVTEHKNQNNNTASPAQKKLSRERNTSEKTKQSISESANGTIKTDNDNIKTTEDNIRDTDDNNKTADDNKSVSDNIESINSSMDDEEAFKEIDEEELVFVKFKNMHTSYFKINYLSYNTLVYMGRGIKHCFACSITVPASKLQKHIDGREHTENVAKNKFLDKYGVQLFRQMYLMYHCAICNVLMTRKEIKKHLDWPEHIECYDTAHVIRNKKNRKEQKSGIKEFVVETQKEAIFHNVNEPKINIIYAYEFVSNLGVEKEAEADAKPTKGSKPTVVKKKKMVIVNNVVMKVDFDHWHAIACSKNVTKCIICQVEIRPKQVMEHVETEYHSVALGKDFDKTYYPALIRKINASTVNCMICNIELPDKEFVVHEHVNGRKHGKNQENIINESSNSDSYTDCYEECLNL